MATLQFSTDKGVKALPKAEAGKRYISWYTPPGPRGDNLKRARRFGVRVTEHGTKTFLVIKRIAGRSAPVTHVLGKYPDLTLAAALKRAEASLQLLNDGVHPLERRREEAEKAEVLGKDSFKAIVEGGFFKDKKFLKNRKHKDTKSIFDLYLIPTFGSRQIGSIKRREIAELLDTIEAKRFKAEDGRKLGGPSMADHVLAALRRMMNWHAARDSDFVTPIVRGMARTKPSETARDRTLSNDEIRALWLALDTLPYHQSRDSSMPGDVFAGFVRTLLLTAQRRDEVAKMKRKEIGTVKWTELVNNKPVPAQMENVWTIPAERYKTKVPYDVPLSSAALEVISAIPRINESDLVFTTNGKTAYSGFSRSKERLDKAMLAKLKAAAADSGADPDEVELLPWRFHDLRRTARTLMAEANVRPDVAERVLGHMIKGVAGTYDRSKILPQKREALSVLGKVVMNIVTPEPATNVVPMPKRKPKRS